MSKNSFNPKSIENLKEIIELAHQSDKKIITTTSNAPARLPLFDQAFIVSLSFLDNIIDIDTWNLKVKVEASVRIERLIDVLEKNELELPVIGYYSEYDTISDIVLTPLHGSGRAFTILSNYITEVTMLLSTGEIVTYSRIVDPDVFSAVLCSLGCLGIILNVVIQCDYLKNYKQINYGLKLEDALVALESHLKASKYFGMSWYPFTNSVIIYNASVSEIDPFKKASGWFKSVLIGKYFIEFSLWLSRYLKFIIPALNKFVYRLFSSRNSHVDKGLKPVNPLFKLEHTAYEYSIPKSEIVYYLIRIQKWLETNPKVRPHFGFEINFVKADNIWLSPSYMQDSCFIKIMFFRPYGKTHMNSIWLKINELLVKQCHGRPSLNTENSFNANFLAKLYPKLTDFNVLRKQLDPSEMFLTTSNHKKLFMPSV